MVFSIFLKKRSVGVRKKKSVESVELDRLVRKLAQNIDDRGKKNVLNYLNLDDWAALDECFERYGAPTVFDHLRPLFSSWQEKYIALINLFRDAGYKARGVDEFKAKDLNKPFLYLYHDVHAWDVLAAMAIADVNLRYDFKSTFFLNWGFSPLDHKLEASYRVFRHIESKNVRIGMHAGPLSSWIRHSVFCGDDENFSNWAAKRENIEKEILCFLEGSSSKAFNKYTIDDALEGMELFLSENLREMRQCFSNVNVVNHHGDEVGRVVTLSNRQLPKKIINLFTASSSEFYNRERLKRLFLQENLANIWRENEGIISYPEGRHKNQYFPDLAEKVQSKNNVFLINHPDNFRAGEVIYDVEFVKKYTKKWLG